MDKRIEIRCTDKEFARYSEAARKSGRNLSAWLRWVANTASDSPIIERVQGVVDESRTGEVPPVSQSSFSAGRFQLTKPKGFSVDCSLDDGVVTILVNGEEVPYSSPQALDSLRLPPWEFPSSVIADIRKKLRELN